MQLKLKRLKAQRRRDAAIERAQKLEEVQLLHDAGMRFVSWQCERR